MTEVLTIHTDIDIIRHYQKQKSEFHFDNKNDSDFLVFLLDTAVRVISIGMCLMLCVSFCVCICT